MATATPTKVRSFSNKLRTEAERGDFWLHAILRFHTMVCILSLNIQQFNSARHITFIYLEVLGLSVSQLHKIPSWTSISDHLMFLMVPFSPEVCVLLETTLFSSLLSKLVFSIIQTFILGGRGRPVGGEGNDGAFPLHDASGARGQRNPFQQQQFKLTLTLHYLIVYLSFSMLLRKFMISILRRYFCYIT